MPPRFFCGVCGRELSEGLLATSRERRCNGCGEKVPALCLAPACGTPVAGAYCIRCGASAPSSAAHGPGGQRHSYPAPVPPRAAVSFDPSAISHTPALPILTPGQTSPRDTGGVRRHTSFRTTALPAPGPRPPSPALAVGGGGAPLASSGGASPLLDPAEVQYREAVAAGLAGTAAVVDVARTRPREATARSAAWWSLAEVMRAASSPSVRQLSLAHNALTSADVLVHIVPWLSSHAAHIRTVVLSGNTGVQSDCAMALLRAARAAPAGSPPVVVECDETGIPPRMRSALMGVGADDEFSVHRRAMGERAVDTDKKRVELNRMGIKYREAGADPNFK